MKTRNLAIIGVYVTFFWLVLPATVKAGNDVNNAAGDDATVAASAPPINEASPPPCPSAPAQDRASAASCWDEAAKAIAAKIASQKELSSNTVAPYAPGMAPERPHLEVPSPRLSGSEDRALEDVLAQEDSYRRFQNSSIPLPRDLSPLALYQRQLIEEFVDRRLYGLGSLDLRHGQNYHLRLDYGDARTCRIRHPGLCLNLKF